MLSNDKLKGAEKMGYTGRKIDFGMCAYECVCVYNTLAKHN